MSEKTLKITLFDDSENGETEHEIPAKFEVCGRCEGFGSHLNPSIGEHAYSAEEFEREFDDPESRAAYFQRGGMYDVNCYDCSGLRVVLVADESAAERAGKAEILKAWQKQERRRLQEEADDRRTMARECGQW